MRSARLALVVLALGACSSSEACPDGEPCPPGERVVLSDGSSALEIRARVADTPDERVQGLRGVERLEPRTGMLFVFDEVAARVFTMRDVLIPLDLLMIQGGRVVEVIHMVPCADATASCEYPTRPADAALELPAGTAAAARIGVGALVEADALP